MQSKNNPLNRETLGRKYPFEERNSILFQIISHPLRAVCNVYVANKGFYCFLIYIMVGK